MLSGVYMRTKRDLDAKSVIEDYGFLPEGFSGVYLTKNEELDAVLDEVKLPPKVLISKTLALFKQGRQTDDEVCYPLKNLIENKDQEDIYAPVHNGHGHYIYLKIKKDADTIHIEMQDSKSCSTGTEAAYYYAKHAAKLAGYPSENITSSLTYTHKQQDGTSCPYFVVQKIARALGMTNDLGDDDINQAKLAFVKKSSNMADQLALDNDGLVVNSRLIRGAKKRKYEYYKAQEKEFNESIRHYENAVSHSIPMFENAKSKDGIEKNQKTLEVITRRQTAIIEEVQTPIFVERCSYAQKAKESYQAVTQLDAYKKTLSDEHKEKVETAMIIANGALESVEKKSAEALEKVTKTTLDKMQSEEKDLVHEDIKSKITQAITRDNHLNQNYSNFVKHTLFGRQVQESKGISPQEYRDHLLASAIQNQEVINHFRFITATPQDKRELQDQLDADAKLARELQEQFDQERRSSFRR